MLILNAAHKFSATETFHVARPDYLHKKTQETAGTKTSCLGD